MTPGQQDALTARGRDHGGLAPISAGSAPSALRAAQARLTTSALAHVLLPQGTLLGVQALLVNGAAHFRGRSVRVLQVRHDTALDEDEARLVAERLRLLSTAARRESDRFHASGAGPWTRWVEPVRSGGFVYAAGLPELAGGPPLRVPATDDVTRQEMQALARLVARAGADRPPPGWRVRRLAGVLEAGRDPVLDEDNRPAWAGLSVSQYSCAAVETSPGHTS